MAVRADRSFAARGLSSAFVTALLVALCLAGAPAPARAQAAAGPWDTATLVREAGALTDTELPALEQRATAGDGRSQALLGLAHEMGSAGLKPNSVEALRWLRKAADQGIAWAEMWAGDFYFTGSTGVPKDLYEAMRLYQSAADHGSVQAAFYAGRMYFFGEGVAVNHAEAARWFKRAVAAEPEFVGRMVALAEAPCQTPFCLSLRQIAGAMMARLPELFVGDWDEASREWESVKDLPGFFERCGFTSSNKTEKGDVQNYFCDSEPITDVAAGNRTAAQLADDVAQALPGGWPRRKETRAEGDAYFFENPDYPPIRVSYNTTPGDATNRVTVLIGSVR